MDENLEIYINDHLKEWNNIQKKLWLKLVELNLVEKNDTHIFIKFSAWFDVFFANNNYCPTIKDVLKEFIGEINETQEDS